MGSDKWGEARTASVVDRPTRSHVFTIFGSDDAIAQKNYSLRLAFGRCAQSREGLAFITAVPIRISGRGRRQKAHPVTTSGDQSEQNAGRDQDGGGFSV